MVAGTCSEGGDFPHGCLGNKEEEEPAEVHCHF